MRALKPLCPILGSTARDADDRLAECEDGTVGTLAAAVANDVCRGPAEPLRLRPEEAL